MALKKRFRKQRRRLNKRVYRFFHRREVVVRVLLFRLIFCVVLLGGGWLWYLAFIQDIPIVRVLDKQRVVATAYSSTMDQTDSTPCITADGFDLCGQNEENVIATNILPFGTTVRFPTLFGNRIFTVHDRMNMRYNNKPRVDVWLVTLERARLFGVKVTDMEVVEVVHSRQKG